MNGDKQFTHEDYMWLDKHGFLQTGTSESVYICRINNTPIWISAGVKFNCRMDLGYGYDVMRGGDTMLEAIHKTLAAAHEDLAAMQNNLRMAEDNIINGTIHGQEA